MSRIITIIDDATKERIGTFINIATAAEYLFPTVNKKLRDARLYFSIRTGYRVGQTDICDFVSVRKATDEEKKLLNDRWYHIYQGFPSFLIDDRLNKAQRFMQPPARVVTACNNHNNHVIGIFKTIPICAEYLFPDYDDERRNNRVSAALKTGSRITRSDVAPFVTIRNATDEEITLLGERDSCLNTGQRDFMERKQAPAVSEFMIMFFSTKFESPNWIFYYLHIEQRRIYTIKKEGKKPDRIPKFFELLPISTLETWEWYHISGANS